MRLAVCAITGLLMSCVMSCALPQEEQVGAAQFDGDWRAVMRETKAVQHVQNVEFDCAPFTESFFIRVENSIASGFMEADEVYSFTAPVDKRGRFKAHIPTNSVYTYKDTDASRDSNIVLVLEGTLSNRKPSGVFTIGDEAIDSQGCATSVQFVVV